MLDKTDKDSEKPRGGVCLALVILPRKARALGFGLFGWSFKMNGDQQVAGTKVKMQYNELKL